MPINYKTDLDVSTKDVQRKNNFYITFAEIFPGASFAMYLQAFPFPSFGNEVKTLRTGNLVTKYAGGMTPIEDVTVTFREYLDRNTSKTLMQWRNLVARYETGQVGRTVTYKKAGTLYKLPPGNVSRDLGSAVITDDMQKWTISGAWPSLYKEDGYDQSNDGEHVLVSLNLAIDSVIPDFIVPS